MPVHLRVCVTATGVVLLDLKRNRYFALGAREARALATLALNWSQAATQSQRTLDPLPADDAAALAEALVKAGFLATRPSADEAPMPASIDLDAALIGVDHELRPAATRLRLHHVLAFVRACIWARRAVSSRSLHAIAREIAGRKRVAAHVDNVQRGMELVSVFQRLRPYVFATKDRCLFHALALLEFLSRYHIHPTWVIAVKPVPWAAHSWLQLDNLVLDCTPEEICGYTPIFAV